MSDASSYFQTNASIEQANRRARKAENTNGSPARLPSKITCACICQDVLCLGESMSSIRLLNLATKTTERVMRGHKGPVTSLCIVPNGAEGPLICSGSWDKTVRVWDRATGACIATLQGHTDFVKALVWVPALRVLLSGSSDSSIMAWDMADPHHIPARPLYVLKSHARGIEDFLALPLQGDAVRLFSAGSESLIKVWTARRDGAQLVGDLRLHESNVYRIKYDADSEQIWTASADGNVLRLTGTLPNGAADPPSMEADTVLSHPDYVRDFVLSNNTYCITACRDENIRVWDIASGKLVRMLEGHFDDVTSLAIYGQQLVSTSLDATVRFWPLEAKELLAYPDLDANLRALAEKKENGVGAGAALTADEEAELAELMSDEE